MTDTVDKIFDHAERVFVTDDDTLYFLFNKEIELPELEGKSAGKALQVEEASKKYMTQDGELIGKKHYMISVDEKTIKRWENDHREIETTTASVVANTI